MSDDKKRKERSVLRRFRRLDSFNQGKKTGSIKVGKTADLVLVEGDASERLSDLRQTRVVILDGKLMDADALRTAAGFSGLPK
jgi:hypothetical protein